MYLVLSAFTSSPISLVAANKASAFSFTVCTLPPSMLTSSASVLGIHNKNIKENSRTRRKKLVHEVRGNTSRKETVWEDEEI
jgi:hypothetical protein